MPLRLRRMSGAGPPAFIVAVFEIAIEGNRSQRKKGCSLRSRIKCGARSRGQGGGRGAGHVGPGTKLTKAPSSPLTSRGSVTTRLRRSLKPSPDTSGPAARRTPACAHSPPLATEPMPLRSSISSLTAQHIGPKVCNASPRPDTGQASFPEELLWMLQCADPGPVVCLPISSQRTSHCFGMVVVDGGVQSRSRPGSDAENAKQRITTPSVKQCVICEVLSAGFKSAEV